MRDGRSPIERMLDPLGEGHLSRKSWAVLATVSMVVSLLVAAPAGAAELDPAEFEPATATVASENPFKGLADGTFIVTLDDSPLALYEGGIAGLKPTSTMGRSRLDVAAPAAVAYRAHLEAQQTLTLARIDRDLERTVTVDARFYNAVNGFAAELTAAEAARVMRMPGVASVAPDVMRQITTDAGPGWIGAPSIWDGTATGVATLGEGVIVGVLDTGINPENPSFADIGADGYDHTNPFGAGVYVGVCNPADPDYQPGFVCNDKLIGAWNATADAGPIDDDGHGSHTASTAAGNVVQATVAAPTMTITPMISGVAPHANIIAYDVCNLGGCPGFAILEGIDRAIADGVHVINYSIGSDTPDNPWAAPDQLGFLAAREAGIFVATSAGNNGPGAATSGSPNAPWMTHVAATTHNRKFVNSVGSFAGGDAALPDIEGLGFTSGYGPANIVYAGDIPSASTGTPELCGAGVPLTFTSPWPAGTFSGEIVVCDRGEYGRVEKGANVLAAGAGGFVLVDDGGGLSGDAHALPGVHVSQSDGADLKAWLATGSGHTASIGGAVESISDVNADIMAGFSSRGPNSAVDMVIPSIAAPGVDIIAADGTDGATSWGFLSGTSMASPHVAGSAALLIALHPDWTPAEVQSALQLTAAHTVLKEDGVTPATPYDRGSGRVDLRAAANAGLVMDESSADYLAADPSSGGDIGAINLASMAKSSCVITCTWTRTVTATEPLRWAASGVGADGLTVVVSPATFELTTGESIELTVTADVSGVSSDQPVFGYAVLEAVGGSAAGDVPIAAMPVAVTADTGDLPEALHITTRRNAGSWQVDDLTALEITNLDVAIDGLTKATSDAGAIPMDSNNGDVFDDVADGTFLKLLEVAAGSTKLIAETLTSESPDLDLFVGLDDGDGIPSAAELVCASTSSNAIENCTVDDPAAGQWWILVQNWSSSAPDAVDAFTLASAVLDGSDADNMSVEGPGAVGALEPFSLRVFWDQDMEAGDRFYGAVTLGTDAGSSGNLGTIDIVLDRHADDVTKTASTAMAMHGDSVTYEISVLPNVMNEDLEYFITDTIPTGMTYVEGSATAGATVANGVLTWMGQMPSPFLAAGSYAATTNAADASCDTPFGGYVNLEDFAITPDPGVAGDTVAYTAFTSGDSISFYGIEHDGMGFTDDGFAIFDVAANYSGLPWINQTLPDPAAPNNLAAVLWQDFEIHYDAATNTGVTLATAEDGALLLVEYDDLQLFGGSDPMLDMEIFVWRTPDSAPGAWEIMMAYDNVAEAIPGTIGVEDASGSAAAGVDASAAATGTVVCFDWTGPSFEPVTITYEVAVDDDAPLGALSNAVTSETDNLGGAATSASAEVEIVDAPAVALYGQIADLSGWLADIPDGLSSADVARLRAAHDALANAMTPRRWVNEVTLDPVTGGAVFWRLRKAVIELGSMDKNGPIQADKNRMRRRLVKVAAHVAHQAFVDAVASGAEIEDLDAAQSQLDVAQRRQDRRRWKKAINANRKAWLLATKHL